MTTNIQAIYKDEDGDIWINQNRLGLGIYKKGNNEVIWYKDIPALKELSGIESISCLGHSSLDDEILIGPSYQPFVYIVKKEKGQVSLSSKIDLQQYVKGVGNNPQFFYEDKKHNTWIITSLGLFVKPCNSSGIKTTGFLQRDITGITEDDLGHIWVSTRRNGVFGLTVSEDFQIEQKNIVRLDMKSAQLMSDNIESLCADKDGKIWMGSQEGYIFVYNQKTKSIEDFSDVFVTLTEGIQNMFMDVTGHLWISTNKRIIEYDLQTGGQVSYQAGEDVVVNSFAKNSYFKDHSGEIYYGGNKGLAVFCPL